MHYIRLVLFLAASAAALAPAAARAQSMTVFGGDSFAKECYLAATVAAQMHIASGADLANCDRAIEHGKLGFADRVATYVNRGVIHTALEHYQEAARDYARAMNLDPQAAAVYVNRGNLYFLSRVYDQAVAEYSRALDLGLNQDHIAHYNRGMAFEKLGDLDQARGDYRRALELVPDWPLPQLRLSRLDSAAR